MERLRYISVPLNEQGVKEYSYGEESSNIKVFSINESQFSIMEELGIFDKINNTCELLIDDYESEEIKGSNLEIALNITKDTNCELLTTALELAIKYNTLVGLDF